MFNTYEYKCKYYDIFLLENSHAGKNLRKLNYNLQWQEFFFFNRSKCRKIHCRFEKNMLVCLTSYAQRGLYLHERYVYNVCDINLSRNNLHIEMISHFNVSRPYTFPSSSFIVDFSWFSLAHWLFNIMLLNFPLQYLCIQRIEMCMLYDFASDFKSRKSIADDQKNENTNAKSGKHIALNWK